MKLDDIEIVGRDTADVDDSVYLRGPPGTGKTTTAAGRVGELLRDHDYDLSDVVWVTYRKSLAMDTLRRFVSWDLLNPEELDEPHTGATRTIGTLHAVGRRTILDSLTRRDLQKEYGARHGQVSNAKYGHKIDFCQKRNLQFRSPNPWTKTEGQLLFSTLNWLRNNQLDPHSEDDARTCSHYRQLRDEHNWTGDLGRIYDDWRDYRAQKGLMDYPEMLADPLSKGVVPDGNILVVDEFHDATPLMASLIEMWAEHMDVVIVAGDPDQIVNGYAGPSRDLFRRVKDSLGLPEVLLDHSYRVPETHWQAATSILSEAHEPPKVNRDGFGDIREYASPTFEPSRPSDDWGQTPSPGTPAGPVDLVESNDGTMMFLARMRIQVAGVSAALNKAGIIHKSQKANGSNHRIGGWNEDGDDRLDLHNALQKVSMADPGTSFGTNRSLDQFDVNTKPTDSIPLTASEASALLHYVPSKHLDSPRSDINDERDDIEDAGLVLKLDEIEHLLADSFWSFSSNPVRAARNLNKRGMSDDDRRALMEALKRYYRAVSADSVRVSVQTIHAAKGGEAEHVVVYDGVSNRILESIHEPDSFKNEMRVWYVALTRSSDIIHLMRGAFAPMGHSAIIPPDIRETVQQRVAGDSQ